MKTEVLKPKQLAAAHAPQPDKETKRLSKLGQWMRDNPGGIHEYVDWQYINRKKY